VVDGAGEGRRYGDDDDGDDGGASSSASDGSDAGSDSQDGEGDESGTGDGAEGQGDTTGAASASAASGTPAKALPSTARPRGRPRKVESAVTATSAALPSDGEAGDGAASASKTKKKAPVNAATLAALHKVKQEEDAHKKREFIDENRDKKWEKPPAVAYALESYKAMVRSRGTRLRKLHAPLPQEPGTVPGSATTLDTPTPEQLLLLNGDPTKSEHPVNVPGAKHGFLPSPHTFPYSCDAKLAQVDEAVRAANNQSRPA